MAVEQERLYALGIDAFRLAACCCTADRKPALDGVTGRITLEADRHFARVLAPAGRRRPRHPAAPAQ